MLQRMIYEAIMLGLTPAVVEYEENAALTVLKWYTDNDMQERAEYWRSNLIVHGIL